MSLEENKAIIRSLYEAFNKHNPDLLDEIMAIDFVDAPKTPFELRGLGSYKNRSIVRILDGQSYVT